MAKQITTTDADALDPVEQQVPVGMFITDPSQGIGVAGMLADDPSLQSAELTMAEWQDRLKRYLASPRP